jgi:hypothetical protein
MIYTDVCRNHYLHEKKKVCILPRIYRYSLLTRNIFRTDIIKIRGNIAPKPWASEYHWGGGGDIKIFRSTLVWWPPPHPDLGKFERGDTLPEVTEPQSEIERQVLHHWRAATSCPCKRNNRPWPPTFRLADEYSLCLHGFSGLVVHSSQLPSAETRQNGRGTPMVTRPSECLCPLGPYRTLRRWTWLWPGLCA